MPVSRACRCCNLLSSFYCRSRTSCLVAGVAETDWILFLREGGTKVVAFRLCTTEEGGLSLGCLLCRCL